MKRINFLILVMFLICSISSNSFAQETNQNKPTGKIAFCQRNGQYWQIWTMDLDGSNKKQLTDSKVDKRSPDFSSDGQKIAYVTTEGELWVMDKDGNNQTKIPLNIPASEPKWCFKDSKIIFTSYRGIYFLDDSDIWLIDIDSLNLKKDYVKTAFIANYHESKNTNDHEFISGNSHKINGNSRSDKIFQRPLKKVIRRPSLQFLPDVSEDDKELLFVDVLEISSHEIFKLNLETGDFIQLTDNNYHDTSPVFSSDNSKIVYACDKDGNYDIWVMDEFGQNPKNLTNHSAFDSSPIVTKDNKIFFLSDRTKTMQIWSMDIEGNNLKQITNDKDDKQDISIYAP